MTDALLAWPGGDPAAGPGRAAPSEPRPQAPATETPPSDRVRWIAHRGWSARFPENSLAAFAAAVAAGADELELDVRYSADGVAVVSHDATLDRIGAGTGIVGLRTWAELRDATLHGPDDRPLHGMGFARLDTVLRLFAPFAGFNVHVKEVGDGSALRDVQQTALRHPERLVYIAGDEEVLEAAIDLCPEVKRCCLARQREPAALLAAALRYRCDGLQFVATNVHPDGITEARAHGLFRNLFYADRVEDARAAIHDGIDGILTNDIGPVRRGVLGAT